MLHSRTIHKGPDDGSRRVDGAGAAAHRAGGIETGEVAILRTYEAVCGSTLARREHAPLACDLTRRIHTGKNCAACAGEVKPGESSPPQNETVAGTPCVEIAAHNVTLGRDPVGRGRCGAGNVERREHARVREENEAMAGAL